MMILDPAVQRRVAKRARTFLGLRTPVSVKSKISFLQHIIPMVQEEDADLAAGLELFLTMAPGPLRRALAENATLHQALSLHEGDESARLKGEDLISTPLDAMVAAQSRRWRSRFRDLLTVLVTYVTESTLSGSVHAGVHAGHAPPVEKQLSPEHVSVRAQAWLSLAVQALPWSVLRETVDVMKRYTRRGRATEAKRREMLQEVQVALAAFPEVRSAAMDVLEDADRVGHATVASMERRVVAGSLTRQDILDSAIQALSNRAAVATAAGSDSGALHDMDQLMRSTEEAEEAVEAWPYPTPDRPSHPGSQAHGALLALLHLRHMLMWGSVDPEPRPVDPEAQFFLVYRCALLLSQHDHERLSSRMLRFESEAPLGKVSYATFLHDVEHVCGSHSHLIVPLVHQVLHTFPTSALRRASTVMRRAAERGDASTGFTLRALDRASLSAMSERTERMSLMRALGKGLEAPLGGKDGQAPSSGLGLGAGDTTSLPSFGDVDHTSLPLLQPIAPTDDHLMGIPRPGVSDMHFLRSMLPPPAQVRRGGLKSGQSASEYIGVRQLGVGGYRGAPAAFVEALRAPVVDQERVSESSVADAWQGLAQAVEHAVGEEGEGGHTSALLSPFLLIRAAGRAACVLEETAEEHRDPMAAAARAWREAESGSEALWGRGAGAEAMMRAAAADTLLFGIPGGARLFGEQPRVAHLAHGTSLLGASLSHAALAGAPDAAAAEEGWEPVSAEEAAASAETWRPSSRGPRGPLNALQAVPVGVGMAAASLVRVATREAREALQSLVRAASASPSTATASEAATSRPHSLGERLMDPFSTSEEGDVARAAWSGKGGGWNSQDHAAAAAAAHGLDLDAVEDHSEDEEEGGDVEEAAAAALGHSSGENDDVEEESEEEGGRAGSPGLGSGARGGSLQWDGLRLDSEPEGGSVALDDIVEDAAALSVDAGGAMDDGADGEGSPLWREGSPAAGRPAQAGAVAPGALADADVLAMAGAEDVFSMSEGRETGALERGVEVERERGEEGEGLEIRRAFPSLLTGRMMEVAVWLPAEVEAFVRSWDREGGGSEEGEENGAWPRSLEVPGFPVFVDNLPVRADPDMLRRALSRCGPVEQVEVFDEHRRGAPNVLEEVDLKRMRRVARTHVYGFVYFKTREAQQRALSDALRILGIVLQDASPGGKGRKARSYVAHTASAEAQRTLFVGNIPLGVNRKQFCSILNGVVGDALSVEVRDLDVTLPRTALGRGDVDPSLPGYVFVEFDTYAQAYRASQLLRHCSIDGKSLAVGWSVEAPQGGGE